MVVDRSCVVDECNLDVNDAEAVDAIAEVVVDDLTDAVDDNNIGSSEVLATHKGPNVIFAVGNTFSVDAATTLFNVVITGDDVGVTDELSGTDTSIVDVNDDISIDMIVDASVVAAASVIGTTSVSATPLVDAAIGTVVAGASVIVVIDVINVVISSGGVVVFNIVVSRTESALVTLCCEDNNDDRSSVVVILATEGITVANDVTASFVVADIVPLVDV